MKWASVIAASILMVGAVADAKTIWNDRNPYAAQGDLNVGAVIVVRVNDLSDMKFTITTNAKSDASVSSNPDMTITGFLPKVTATKKITGDDATQFTGKGKLNFSIAARVMNRVAGGMLAIAGSRTYTFHGVTTIVTVTGLVDPALMRGRVIDSNSVADFTIEIRGLKEGIQIQRQALKEGEKASAELTEEEKQRIIIDYLKKMLGELTR